MATIPFPTLMEIDFGAIQVLGKALKRNGISRPLICTDKGVIDCGVFDMVRSVLPNDITPTVYDGTPGNPTERAVRDALALYQDNDCDGIIAIGGGSSIDLGKGVALTSSHDGPIDNCYSTGNANGNNNVGGFTGENNDAITNSYSTGSANGNNNVGGFVGDNSDAITNSYSTGSATGIGDDVGGFAGFSDGSIDNCYSTGNVNGNSDIGGFIGFNVGSIDNCYSTGNAIGTGSDIGGFMGTGFAITDCFWDIDASGNMSNVGNVGMGGNVLTKTTRKSPPKISPKSNEIEA